jgi:DNA invertase Pin-like site-specific DNA recombinase
MESAMAQVGYQRVSSVGQNVERQLEGLVLDETFTDRISGKSLDRPALQEMLRYVRKGDEVVVHSMDRLARNLADLLKLVTDLTGKGVRVTFKKEALTFTGEDSPVTTLMLSIIGATASFERSMILERQREGIAIAKAKGNVYKGGKPKLSPVQAVQLRERAQAGEKKAVLAREFGISRETVYQYLRAGSAA